MYPIEYRSVKHDAGQGFALRFGSPYISVMSNHDQGRPWKRPRKEPEIIPPERSGRDDNARGIWIAVNEQGEPGGRRRVYVARPGPFTIIVALAVLALIAAVILIVLLSLALLWIPVVIVLVAALILSVSVRQYWWRFRSWLARR